MNKLIVLLSFAGLVSGCATTPQMQPITFQSKLINSPELNVVTEGEIGLTIVSKTFSKNIPTIIVENSISEYRKQPATNNRWSGTLELPAGHYQVRTEDENGWYYPVNGRGLYKSTAANFPCTVCGIFIPKSEPNATYTYYYYEQTGSSGIEVGKNNLNLPKSNMPIVSEGSTKIELIYGGLSQKVISISYREFKNDFARPAFTQELKYDLNDGDVIGFRGARFQVLKASNTVLTYKVLKHLD